MEKETEIEYSKLSEILIEDPSLGYTISGKALQKDKPQSIETPSLKYYFHDQNTSEIITHNLRWSNNEIRNPKFQFAYLMLPTRCNQKCKGCFMGQDKSTLSQHLFGPPFSKKELMEILSFLRSHGSQTIVYGGCGELFTWEGAFDFLDLLVEHNFNIVIFTNGTLLSKAGINYLNSVRASLIVSIRDTNEVYHNNVVQMNGFRKVLSTIDHALQEGFQDDNRLAVEIPVTLNNESRVIVDFLPAMRYLGIVPMIEEYIRSTIALDEWLFCHNFKQSRSFFQKINNKDRLLGYNWTLKSGQRMIAQPKCQRPLYSFTVFPNRDVVDCPSHNYIYGNLNRLSISEIIYSDRFRDSLRNYNYCPCSVFYTEHEGNIPEDLPNYLKVYR